MSGIVKRVKCTVTVIRVELSQKSVARRHLDFAVLSLDRGRFFNGHKLENVRMKRVRAFLVLAGGWCFQMRLVGAFFGAFVGWWSWLLFMGITDITIGNLPGGLFVAACAIAGCLIEDSYLKRRR